MSARVNFEVIAGQRRVSEVRVHGEGGEVLSGPEWTMYGGAICDGFAPVRMRCTEEGGLWRVVLPGLKRGAMPWRWQLFLQEVSTGVEWLVAEGEVRVRERRAEAVDPVDDELTELVCVLSADRAAFDVTLGESTAAAVLAVEQVREYAGHASLAAHDAKTASMAALGSAATANERAAAADDSAVVAAGAARDAAARAADAKDFARDAGEKAAAAGASAEAAAGAAARAAARAADAATSSQVAAEDASAALEARDAAVRAAEIADARMVAAQDAAADAEDAREGADAAATQAQAGAAGAAASASAAAESASAAAESAALLGDAALKSQNNTFTGKNVYTGDINVTGGTVNGMPGGRVGDVLHNMLGENQTIPVALMAQVIPNSDTMEVWDNLPLPVDGLNGTYFKGLKKIYATVSVANSYGFHVYNGDRRLLDEVFLYLPTGVNFHLIYTGAKKVTFWAPTFNNTKKNQHNRLPWACHPNARYVEEVVVYMPQCTGGLLINHWDKTAKLTALKDFKVLGENVFTKVDFDQHFVTGQLTTTAGFPQATYINMPLATLNKESLMLILNNLKAYDSTTMTSMPQLTVGIDPALDGDEEINAALLLAQTAVEDGGKGWSVAVNGFTITAGGGAATLGLRRPVYARRWEDAEGDYVDADGTRWRVRWGNTVLENWLANEQLGYEEFASLEDALEAWGLEAYVPEERGEGGEG